MRQFVVFAAVLGALCGVCAIPAAADDRSTCFGPSTGDDSIAACSRLIASQAPNGPDLAQAYSRRGNNYVVVKGDFDRAMNDYNEAIKLDPRNSSSYAVRGAIFVRQGNFDRALADLNEARRLKPQDALTSNAFGVYYNEKGEYDRAISELNEAIRLWPQYYFAFRNRGISYENKGELPRALADFQVAATFDPDRKTIAGREAADGIKRVEQKLAALAAAKSKADAPQPSPPPATTLQTVEGRRVALVIGNGDYRYAPPLPNPVNDASDIAAALRKLGFDVVEGKNLDRRGMDEALRTFGRKLDGAKLALFFYAGHGLQVNGKNYLVPIDARLERLGDLPIDAVDIGNVLAQMEEEKRVNLVFLDACRDNPLARSLSRSLGTRSISVGQGLASIQSAIGTMIVYATQPDNVALDGTGRNSPFTTALLKHIATPGIDISALMRRVRSDVIAATNEKQVPWDHSSLTGDVILVK
jgi:tetratricopeptide (TPR) repeat protein